MPGSGGGRDVAGTDAGVGGGGAGQGMATRAVHAGSAPIGRLVPVVQPIFQTATFLTEMADDAEVGYTRYGNNPNLEALGARLAALEGAEAALAVASGNAAMALLLLSMAASGDRIVAPRQLYGGTLRLLLRDLPRLGIETDFVDFSEDWHSAINAHTRLVLLEMPVNPTLRLPDLPGIAAIAAAHGLPLAVDATFATPVNLRPLEHGASLVMHSATKYLGGHSDVTAGVVAGSVDRVAAVRELMISFGPVLDPHAAWLLERGVKTLGARMARHNENGLAVAHWLAEHPAVEAVHYPGLESHPDHARALTLLDGFGGMVGVVVKGGDDAAVAALRRLRLFAIAPSLGGVESLVSMPRFTSHAALTDAERRAIGIEPGFVRLSLGIEDAADLIADLGQALAAGD
jgi:cystathionine beta-lyase/cystathionine gamma-synthase